MAVFGVCFQEYAIRKGCPAPAISQEDLVNPWDPHWGPGAFLLLNLYYRLHTVKHLIKVQCVLTVSLGLFFCCYRIPQSQFWPFLLCMLLRSFSALLPLCSLSPMECLSCSVWVIRFSSLHFYSLDLLQCFLTIAWGSLVHCLRYLCFSSVGSSHELRNWFLSGFYDIKPHSDAHMTNSRFWLSVLLFLNAPSLSPEP